MLAQKIDASPVAFQIQPASFNSVLSFNASLERQMAANEGAAPAIGQSDQALKSAAPVRNTEDDLILGGLQRLRGAFDAQETRMSDAMTGAISDTNAMLAMQVEMTNFSLFIEMTSKLVSNGAQGLDTLMKG